MFAGDEDELVVDDVLVPDGAGDIEMVGEDDCRLVVESMRPLLLNSSRAEAMSLMRIMVLPPLPPSPSSLASMVVAVVEGQP